MTGKSIGVNIDAAVAHVKGWPAMSCAAPPSTYPLRPPKDCFVNRFLDGIRTKSAQLWWEEEKERRSHDSDTV